MLPAAGLLTLSASCAETTTTALPAYQLANGRIVQDVVTVAADGSGGAPVITALTTYDVSEPGTTLVIARESASAPGVGLLLASTGAAAVTSAAVLGTALLLDEEDESATVVNASYATSGNSATGGGDAGDIDSVTAAFGECGTDCSVSN